LCTSGIDGLLVMGLGELVTGVLLQCGRRGDFFASMLLVPASSCHWVLLTLCLRSLHVSGFRSDGVEGVGCVSGRFVGWVGVCLQRALMVIFCCSAWAAVQASGSLSISTCLCRLL
jgi:hypothetical protein